MIVEFNIDEIVEHLKRKNSNYYATRATRFLLISTMYLWAGVGAAKEGLEKGGGGLERRGWNLYFSYAV
jgi:hypothetical protein